MLQAMALILVSLIVFSAPGFSSAAADGDDGFCETYEPDCDRIP